jgi:hypothetical protein
MMSDSINGEIIGVMDTEDGVVDKVTPDQLRNIVKTCKLKIKGVSESGDINLYNFRKMSDLLATWKRLMNRTGGGYYFESDEKAGTASIRDWGNWEVPEGVDEDEAMDYDWEVLSEKSTRMLKIVKKEMQERFVDYNITITTGEKNYIYLTAKLKK